MEARRLLGIFALMCALMAPTSVSGYSADTTHPALTREMAALYNAYHWDRPLLDDEINALAAGSTDEDEDFRFMRHFYDPVHRHGLTTLAELAGATAWPSAREWVNSQPGVTVSYTWDEALRLLREGDRIAAFRTLGHVLHLAQDMSVPDHVRNDPHPPILNLGSPYESWTKQFGPELFDSAAALASKSIAPADYADVDSAIHETAAFTNRHFFSKDTIGSAAYDAPVIEYRGVEMSKEGEEITFGYRRDETGNPVRLVRIAKGFSFANASFYDRYLLTDPDARVLADYWTRLSRHAIVSGARILELFMQAAQPDAPTVRQTPIAETPDFYKKILSIQIPKEAQTDDPADEGAPPPTHIASIAAQFAPAGAAIPPLGDVHFEKETPEEPGLQFIAPTVPASQPAPAPTVPPEIPPATSTPPASPAATTTPVESSEPEPMPIIILPAVAQSDMTLDPSVGVYVVNGTFRIPAGITVRLLAGTIVKIKSGGVWESAGDTIAEGSADSPVVFTAFSDDAHGGDSNADGTCGRDVAASCPRPGSWFRVDILATSRASSFRFTRFRFGGDAYSESPPDVRAMVRVAGANAVFEDCAIESSRNNGVYFVDAAARFTRCSLRTNGSTAGDAAIVVTGGAPVISGNIFSDNRTGISLFSSAADVVDNSFIRHSYRPFRIDGPLAGTISGNTGEGNSVNAISLSGDLARRGATSTLHANGLPYFFDIAPAGIPPGAAVVAVPGTVFMFSQKYLIIEGRLELLGEPGQPIRHTSASDTLAPDYTGNQVTRNLRVVDGGHLLARHARFSHFFRAVEVFSGSVAHFGLSFVNVLHPFEKSGSASVVELED